MPPIAETAIPDVFSEDSNTSLKTREVDPSRSREDSSVSQGSCCSNQHYHDRDSDSKHIEFCSYDLVSCGRESLHCDCSEGKPTACLQRSRMICRGRLHCRSDRWSMIWHNRYFSLKGGVIEEYKTEKEFRAKSPPMYRSEVVHAEVWGGKMYGFLFTTKDGDTFYVHSESRWDFLRWLNSLTGASSEYQEQVVDDHIVEPQEEENQEDEHKHVGFADEVEVYNVKPVGDEFKDDYYYSRQELTQFINNCVTSSWLKIS